MELFTAVLFGLIGAGVIHLQHILSSKKLESGNAPIAAVIPQPIPKKFVTPVLFGITTMTVKNEYVNDFVTMMVKNAKITKQIEEGCLRFDVIKQNGSENSFAFVEVYKDGPSVGAHFAGEAFKEWSEMKLTYLESPETTIVYESVEYTP